MTYTGHKTSAYHMVWRILTFENSFNQIEKTKKEDSFWLVIVKIQNLWFVIENVMITEQLKNFTK